MLLGCPKYPLSIDDLHVLISYRCACYWTTSKKRARRTCEAHHGASGASRVRVTRINEMAELNVHNEPPSMYACASARENNDS